MAELANFLPTIGAPSSGGGFSFKKVAVTLPTAAAQGEAVFMNQFGEYKLESQLVSYDNALPNFSNQYPSPFVADNSNLIYYRSTDSPLVMVASGSAGCARPSTNLHVSNGGLNRQMLYSCQLSSGVWVVLNSASASGRVYSSGNGITISVLSSDCRSLLHTMHAYASQINGLGNGTYGVDIRYVIPVGTNQFRIVSETRAEGASSVYQYSVLCTWNGSSLATSGLTLLRGTSSDEAGNFTAKIIGGSFSYGGTNYALLVSNSGNSLHIYNASTNTISSNITLPSGYFQPGSADVGYAVVCGTALHIYRNYTNTALAPVIINLTNMTRVTTGLPAALSTITSDVVGLVRLDSTTYAIRVASSNTYTSWSLVTIRCSADGVTSATYTSTTFSPSTTKPILGMYLWRGKNYILMGNSVAKDYQLNGLGYSTSARGSEVRELTYDSGSGSCTISSPLLSVNRKEVPIDLIHRFTGGYSTAAIDLTSSNLIIPICADTTSTYNSGGAMVLQTFSIEHHLGYEPVYIGRTLTAGSSIEILLDGGNVFSFESSLPGIVYGNNVLGVAQGYAAYMLDQVNPAIPKEFEAEIGTASAYTEPLGLFNSNSGMGDQTQLITGSVVKTLPQYSTPRVEFQHYSSTDSNATSGSGYKIINVVSNGHVFRNSVLLYNNTHTSKGSRYTVRFKWEGNWPLIFTTPIAEYTYPVGTSDSIIWRTK